MDGALNYIMKVDNGERAAPPAKPRSEESDGASAPSNRDVNETRSSDEARDEGEFAQMVDDRSRKDDAPTDAGKAKKESVAAGEKPAQGNEPGSDDGKLGFAVAAATAERSEPVKGAAGPAVVVKATPNGVTLAGADAQRDIAAAMTAPRKDGDARAVKEGAFHGEIVDARFRSNDGVSAKAVAESAYVVSKTPVKSVQTTIGAAGESVLAGGEAKAPLDGDALEGLLKDARSMDVGREGIKSVTTIAANKTLASPAVATMLQVQSGDIVQDLSGALSGAMDEAGFAKSTLQSTVGLTSGGGLAATSLAAAGAVSPAVQIVAAMRTEKNPGVIEVRLDPPELGRVRIDFTMETGEAVKAVITAERSETLDHMRRNNSELLEELRAAGFGSVDLEFSGEGASNFSEEFGGGDGFSSTSGKVNEMTPDGVVYLSLRDDAALDILV